MRTLSERTIVLFVATNNWEGNAIVVLTTMRPRDCRSKKRQYAYCPGDNHVVRRTIGSCVNSALPPKVKTIDTTLRVNI